MLIWCFQLSFVAALSFATHTWYENEKPDWPATCSVPRKVFLVFVFVLILHLTPWKGVSGVSPRN